MKASWRPHNANALSALAQDVCGMDYRDRKTYTQFCECGTFAEFAAHCESSMPKPKGKGSRSAVPITDADVVRLRRPC